MGRRDELLTVVYAWAVGRLRGELDAHLHEHGCGTGDYSDPRYIGGFINCPTAASLWGLLPASERICLAAA